MHFYSQAERKYAVVETVVLSASLIMGNKSQGNGSPFVYLPDQTGCQNQCFGRATDFFRIYYSAVLYALLLLLLCACDKSKHQAPAQGDQFPRFELQKLLPTGDSRPDFSGKTLVINFWASWCVPCREEMATLQQLSDAMDKKSYLVMGISVDEDSNLMQEFLYQHNIRFDNFLDQQQNLAQNILGIRAYPETFIVSPQGIIVRRIAGQRDWNSPSIHRLLKSIHRGVKSARVSGVSVSRLKVKLPIHINTSGSGLVLHG